MVGVGDSTLINNEVPEKEGGYPDAQGFLKTCLLSMGFYVRHAENVNINNAEIIPFPPDFRPLIFIGKEVKKIKFNGENK